MGSVKKIVVLGAVGAGKSTVLQKITADEVSTKASPTVGLRIYSLAVRSGDLEKMVFWELTNAGSLTLQPVDYLKGAHAGLYVFDLSRPSTYEVLDQELKILRSMLPECPLIVLGNKADLISKEEIEQISTSLSHVPFIATSAHKAIGLKEVFNQLTSILA